MREIRLFDLLGLDAADAAAAAALLPNDCSLTRGLAAGGADDRLVIANLLQAGVTFTEVHAGAGTITIDTGVTGQTSLTALMHVDGSLQPHPFYLGVMPDIGITLMATVPNAPARVFFAKDARGFEVIIEALPVIVSLKDSMLRPVDPSEPEEGDSGLFALEAADGFATVRRQSPDGSQIYAKARIHRHPDGKTVFETSVPISFPPSRFLDLPVNAVYDVNLIPSPSRIDDFEWARHDLGTFISNPPVSGAFGFRSIDFDFSKRPLSDLKERLSGDAMNVGKIELVCEDVVFPLFSPLLVFPLPSHGTFGFRRKVVDRSNVKEAFSLKPADAAVSIQLYPSPGADSSSGSKWTLTMDQLLFQTGTPPTVLLQMAVVWQRDEKPVLAATFAIADDWTVQIGIALGDDTPVKAKIAGVVIALHAAKLGIGIGRLRRGEPFRDSYQILGDLSIQSEPSTSTTFRIESLSGGTVDMIFREIGWSFGHLSLSGLESAEGVQFVFANVVRLIVEEFGWIEETNGLSYICFSGGVKVTLPGGAFDGGIRFRRLRFRIDGGGPMKLDGIFLDLRFPTLTITGYGYITDTEADGWKIDEWGFGVKLEFKAIAQQFSIAAEFIKGRRKELAHPEHEFGYFMARLELSFLPAGPLGLYGIRLLFAQNMQPNIPSAGGDGMALFHWYRDHLQSISMPANRKLDTWTPVANSFAAGVGSGFSINSFGALTHLDIFIFIAHRDDDDGILIVGELFLLKNLKPIAWAAIEFDPTRDKFGVLVGIDLKLTEFLTAGMTTPSWMNSAPRLSGTLFFGNQPWTIAIGQLADQRTWLGIRAKSSFIADIDFVLAFCLQIVEGGPKGFGFVISANASADWGIGGFVLYGSFGLMIGCWKTGSDTTGIAAWFGFGFRIHLFFVFHFGADISLKISYLGKHPWFATISGSIDIDTPWWLPDVSFGVSKTWGGSPRPLDTRTVTQALESADAIDYGARTSTPLLTPTLPGGNADSGFLYTFNELKTKQGAPLGDVHQRRDIPIFPTTVTIALNFTNPVTNDMAVAPDVDAGVQKVQNLTVRYGLKNLAIRRSPRFGPTAGTWTNLIEAIDTDLSLGGGGSATLHMLPIFWQLDQRSDGRLAPKRLLINAMSPYALTIAGDQADEETLRNDPNAPCCGRGRVPVVHELTFQGTSPGVRVPQRQQFTGDGAFWQWSVAPVPLAAPSVVTADAGRTVARLHPDGSIVLGSADLADPAIQISLEADWSRAKGQIFFEAFRGADLVGDIALDLGASSTRVFTILLNAEHGATRVVLRGSLPRTGGVEDGDGNPLPSETSRHQDFDFQVVRITYVTVADSLAASGHKTRCGNSEATGAFGRLAFLPNHDYEVSITSEVSLSNTGEPPSIARITQPTYFRTNGLPGLNAPRKTATRPTANQSPASLSATADITDELLPLIETTYPPAPKVLIYREEPVVLAFTDGMSSLLPVQAFPPPGAPPEKMQVMEFVLNIDRVGSIDGLRRMTTPTNDWINAHRSSVVASKFPKLTNTRPLKRESGSADPGRIRFERLLASAPRCEVNPLHSSQVLLHDPIAGDGTAGPWEPGTAFRATLRQKKGPFTQRSSFDSFDLAAFRYKAEPGPTRPWQVIEGRFVAPTGAGRQYATIGEASWNHLRMQTRISNLGTPAGLAIGLAAGNAVPRSITATIEGTPAGWMLVLRRRIGAVIADSSTKPIDAVAEPILLSLWAFDDRARASVGDVVVEIDRDIVRDGMVGFFAEGPAQFHDLIVDALDMHRFEFVTSRYVSFEDHIRSFDGTLDLLKLGEMGATASTVAEWQAANAAAIANVMAPSADPQARQALFTEATRRLAIPLRQRTEALGITRIDSGSGTAAILVESPEPLALSRDVRATLIQHVSFFPSEILSLDPGIRSLLSGINRSGDDLTIAADRAHLLRDANLVEVHRDGDTISFVRFGVPRRDESGRKATIPADDEIISRVGVYPELDALRLLPHGSVALIAADRTIGGVIKLPTPVDTDLPIALRILTNGDETAAYLFPVDAADNSVQLSAGSYTLRFALTRVRWRAAAATADTIYHREHALMLFW